MVLDRLYNLDRHGAAAGDDGGRLRRRYWSAR